MAVRNESVRLSLQDDFTSGMARAAIAAASLNQELNRLSGQSVQTARVTQNINRDTDAMAKSASRADTSINQLTGRIRLLADVAAILGPALIPIGAVALPAVAGLANQFGAAALAGGTAIIAFQGVGDALKLVNEAALEPTAENLNAAREAMEDLSPAARDMVTRLQELRPVMSGLRDTAAEGLFPGLLEAFDSMETRLPEVERILSSVAETLGEVVAAGAEGLASSRWDDFFDFLATDVPDTLVGLGHTVGDLTHGMAELWMAFDPLNDDFTGWLEDVASGFDGWATGLAQTEGFKEFIDYVRTNGPQVAETFGALADAILQIVQASAPLGGPVLKAIEGIARAAAAIADSDLGTPIMAAVGALALLSRATKGYEAVTATAWGGKAKANITGMVGALTTVTSAQERATSSATTLAAKERERAAAMRQGIGTTARAAAGFAALATASTGLADSMGLANTATLGLVGTMAGAKWGAVGAAAGGILDLSSALSVGADEMDRFMRVLTAQAGPDVGEQIAAVTDEIARLEGIMDDSQGLNLGLTKLWSSDGAAEAAERVEYLRNALAELETQQEVNGEANRRAALEAAAAYRETHKAGDAARDAGDGYRYGAEGVQSFSSALAELNGFFDKRSAIRNYEAALDDFRKGLRETGKSFDITTAKGRDNQARLDDIATSALGVAENLKGIRRTEFVSSVVAQLRTMAGNLNGPAKKAVLDVIRELQNLGRQKPRPDVEVENGPALSSINAVEQRLNALNGKTSRVVIYQDTVERHYRVPGGGRIPLADGGYVRGPGTATSDSIPAQLSNGEYVIRAAAVERYGRETFDRLNAMHFAQGGYVQPMRAAAPVVNVTSSAAAPVMGGVTFAGPIYTTDPKAVAREVSNRQRDALALARLP